MDPWNETRARRKLVESKEKRRKKAHGLGGARPGAGRPPLEDRGEIRKRVATRLTDAERARIEAWGQRRKLGFTAALREAALISTRITPDDRQDFRADLFSIVDLLDVAKSASEWADLVGSLRSAVATAEALREAALRTVERDA